MLGGLPPGTLAGRCPPCAAASAGGAVIEDDELGVEGGPLAVHLDDVVVDGVMAPARGGWGFISPAIAAPSLGSLQALRAMVAASARHHAGRRD